MKFAELARKRDIREASLFGRKAKYGGLDVPQLRRLLVRTEVKQDSRL